MSKFGKSCPKKFASRDIVWLFLLLCDCLSLIKIESIQLLFVFRPIRVSCVFCLASSSQMVWNFKSLLVFQFSFCLWTSSPSCDFRRRGRRNLRPQKSVSEPVWRLRKLSPWWWPEEIISTPMLPWNSCSRFKKIRTAKVWTFDCERWYIIYIYILYNLCFLKANTFKDT